MTSENKEEDLLETNYDYYQNFARSAFADMLHDTERNQKYFLAIKKAIHKIHSQGKKAFVLDIGTGSGILSMMAVKCGADKVVACEAFKPAAECALKVIQDNGYNGKIQIIPKRSDNLTVGRGDSCDLNSDNLPNILVTELFDTELIGEGALEIFKHATNNLLHPDVIIVPSLARYYVQIIESSFINKWNKIQSIKDLNNQILIETPEIVNNCPGDANSLHDLQLSQLSLNNFKIIAKPKIVFEFNWKDKNLNLSEKKCVELKAENSGTAQMVFTWWELSMDEDEDIILSCAPFWEHPDVEKELLNQHDIENSIPWRDHWMQTIYYLPKQVYFQKNDSIYLNCAHDLHSLWFHVVDNLNSFETKSECQCSIHTCLSRTRIGQINDSSRSNELLKKLKIEINSNSVCLVFSHNLSLISLAIAKFGAKHVYILENPLLTKILQQFLDKNKLNDTVTIINKLDELNVEILNQINLIFCEMSFWCSLLPWDNAIEFMNNLNKLKSFDLKQNVKVLPGKFVLNGLAVQFKDLFKIKSPIGDCEGFIMDKFDETYMKAQKLTNENIEAQPLWEYPCNALSQKFKLLEFDFQNYFDSKQMNLNCNNQVLVEIIGQGACNGIVIWTDWFYDNSRITTGILNNVDINKRVKWDYYTRQGVYLLTNSEDTCKKKLKCDISFDTTDGLEFKFKILGLKSFNRLNELISFIEEVNKDNKFF